MMNIMMKLLIAAAVAAVSAEECNLLVDFGSSGPKTYYKKASEPGPFLPNFKVSGASGCANALAIGDATHPCGGFGGTLGQKIAEKLVSEGCDVAKTDLKLVLATAGNRFAHIDNTAMFQKLKIQVIEFAHQGGNDMTVIPGVQEAEYELIASITNGGDNGAIGIGGSSAQISIPASIVGHAFDDFAYTLEMFNGCIDGKSVASDEPTSCGAGQSSDFLTIKQVGEGEERYLLVSFLADHNADSGLHIVGGMDETRAKLGSNDNGSPGTDRCTPFLLAEDAASGVPAMINCLMEDTMFKAFLDRWNTVAVAKRTEYSPTMISQALGVSTRGLNDATKDWKHYQGPHNQFERDGGKYDPVSLVLSQMKDIMGSDLERSVANSYPDLMQHFWDINCHGWAEKYKSDEGFLYVKFDDTSCLDTMYVMSFLTAILGEDGTLAVLKKTNHNPGDWVQGLCITTPHLCQSPSPPSSGVLAAVLAALSSDVEELERIL